MPEDTPRRAQVRISVVIPTYNYAHVLTRAMQSVVGQLDNDCELLVIDDGSTDNTEAVVQALLGGSAALRYLRKDNGGPASTRNRGVAEATGDYLIFLDADDELAPGALALVRQHLQKHPETRMVIGGYLIRSHDRTAERIPSALPDSRSDRVRGYLIDKTISLSNGACVMHRDVFTKGLYPEHFRNAEDIPVFAQALASYPCTTLAAPLAIIHRHDDSLRHTFCHSKEIGIDLVNEVFHRLDGDWQALSRAYFTQRCLSLFREAYLANDVSFAKRFYRMALQHDWTAIFKLPYTRKAIRLWLGIRPHR
ncbi:glycosyltransferase family 2 protein [Pseudomonas citronellolis]|nr:glycosyltransferase family 2 protein [Pseudomonas citronellolis]MDF3935457.1 glycosyltransferase family 2 protein [Pseudomonas citronellolis]